VASVDSQPFAAELSQSAVPALHEMVHVPEEQVTAAFCVLQTLPHAPQLLGSVCLFVQLPLQLT